MRRSIFVLILLLSFFSASATPLVMTNGIRVVPFGDSITDQCWYSHYFESFYRGKYPTVTQHWRTFGFGGLQMNTNSYDASYNIASKFDRYVVGRANLVFILMTPNGSTSSNEFAGTLNFVLTNKITLYSAGLGNATALPLGATPKDTSDGSATQRDRSDAHQAVATSLGIQYVNLWRVIEPAYSNNYANGHPNDLGWSDTIHPGAAGHLTFLYAITRALGESDVITAATIDAVAGTASLTTNTGISSISMTSTGGSFVMLDTRLAPCWDTNAYAGAAGLYPDIATNWAGTWLRVTNLQAGTYLVGCDGVTISTNTHTQLAVGINRTPIQRGPEWGQRIGELMRIRMRDGVQTNAPGTAIPGAGTEGYKGTCNIQFNAPNNKRDQALIDAVASAEATVDALDADVMAAAQPVAHTWTITVQGGDGVSVTYDHINIQGNAQLTGNVLIQ